MKCMLSAAALGLMPGIASQAAAKPLKVVILAGQSNMEGPASIKTFALMGKAVAEAAAHLQTTPRQEH